MTHLAPHAGAPALAVVVILEAHPGEPHAMHVIGWAPLADGGWEAVVADGDGTARRVSTLSEHGVSQVLGMGPVPPPTASPRGGGLLVP